MKITRKAEKINLNNLVDIAVDVHKDTLCFFFEIDGTEYSDTCSNQSRIIDKRLKAYLKIAIENNRKNLRIICEPTGQYHNKLMRIARKNGCFSCFVNAEAVCKFRMVETNDYNKTDQKDPRVISTLGKLNKVIGHRMLDEKYMVLRKLHKLYDDCDIDITSLRCKISKVLVELFCDYSFKKDFLYSRSGQALFQHFGCNPYKIISAGYASLTSKIKQTAPRARRKTLERLWDDATHSVLNHQPQSYIDLLEKHLHQLMSDYLRVVARKENIVQEMTAILNQLRDEDPLIPPPTPHVISDKNLARFLAETGPLSDFEHVRKLMRYGGLNLKTRQSGLFKGHDKISKKGRKLLRKVLQSIALPLVRRGRLYGNYYHKKKEDLMMPGNKAMTIVARHLLRKIFGWYKSGKPFEEKRFFTCESRHKHLALVA